MRQKLYNTEPLDNFDCLESLVHVTEGQVETEVHHCCLGRLLRLLKTDKVTVDSLNHHRLRVRCRLVTRLRYINLSTNNG